MSEQHKAPPAGLWGTTDHVDAGDGWILVRLMTRQALVREGRHMDHCLADGAYANFAGEEDLAGHSIWSLRDPDGLSVVTLDVRRVNDGRAQVVMATGPGNRDVRRSAARRLSRLVAAFRKAGVALDFAGETKLCVADDGRVMREDRAPAEVLVEVKARHAQTIAEAVTGSLRSALEPAASASAGAIPSGMGMVAVAIGAAARDIEEADMPLAVRMQAAKALREAVKLRRSLTAGELD